MSPKQSLTVQRLLKLLAPATLLLGACSSGPKPDWVSIRQYVSETYPTQENITTDELAKRLSENPDDLLLVDARQADEYAVSHLSGAMLVESRRDLGERIRERLKTGNRVKVVVYCSVGVRSASVVRQLTNEGFRGVVNLDGSLFEWANKGFPMVSEGRATTKVHPYNKAWGKLLNSELWSWGDDPAR